MAPRRRGEEEEAPPACFAHTSPPLHPPHHPICLACLWTLNPLCMGRLMQFPSPSSSSGALRFNHSSRVSRHLLPRGDDLNPRRYNVLRISFRRRLELNNATPSGLCTGHWISCKRTRAAIVAFGPPPKRLPCTDLPRISTFGDFAHSHGPVLLMETCAPFKLCFLAANSLFPTKHPPTGREKLFDTHATGLLFPLAPGVYAPYQHANTSRWFDMAWSATKFFASKQKRMYSCLLFRVLFPTMCVSHLTLIQDSDIA